MTTFSQVVDEIVEEVVRPDLVTAIAGYLNQTIRELHIDAKTSMPVLYNENRKEERLTVTGQADNQYMAQWQIPRINVFQTMEAVYYRRSRVYAKEKKPSIARLYQNVDVNAMYYWYRSGVYVVFANAGADGSQIDLSWFEYPTSLMYFVPAKRPLYWDPIENQYMKLPSSLPTPEQLMLVSTNWLIERHVECLREGVRAKVYKRLADETRARLCYSAFESMRSGVISAETISGAIS